MRRKGNVMGKVRSVQVCNKVARLLSESTRKVVGKKAVTTLFVQMAFNKNSMTIVVPCNMYRTLCSWYFVLHYFFEFQILVKHEEHLLGVLSILNFTGQSSEFGPTIILSSHSCYKQHNHCCQRISQALFYGLLMEFYER